MQNLKTNSISAFKWNVIDQIASQALNFVLNIVLMWYLVDSDFGLFAIPFVVVGFVRVMQDFGLSGAVIHDKNQSQLFLSSAFWFTVVLAVVFAALIFVFAPIVGIWTGEIISVGITKWLSLVVLFSGFYWVSESVLVKQLAFKKLFFVNFLSILVSGIFGVYLAMKGYGYQALVVKFVCHTGLLAAGYYLSSPWKPSMQFSRKALLEKKSFTIPLVLEQGLNEISRNIDTLFIGKYLGSSSLGLYDRGYKVLTYPIRQVSGSFSKVLFPTFSHIQDDKERVKKIYLFSIRVISLITFPMMIGLFAMSSEFVLVVFGEKWQALVPIIRIFSLLGLFQSISALGGSVFMAMGKTKLQFKLSLFVKTIVIGSIIFSTIYYQDIYIVALSYAISSFIVMFPEWYFTGKAINLSVFTIIKNISIPFVAGIVMGIIMYFTKTLLLYSFSDPILLVIISILGIALYLLFIFIFDKSRLTEVIHILKEFKSS
jgi:PST family polysaccharide transporter